MNKEAPFWWPDIKSLIAIMLVAGMVILVFALLYVKPPDNQVVLVVIGGFITSTGTIVQFYFGSSQSSKEKDSAFIDIAKKSANGAPPHA